MWKKYYIDEENVVSVCSKPNYSLVETLLALSGTETDSATYLNKYLENRVKMLQRLQSKTLRTVATVPPIYDKWQKSSCADRE